jgi:uncharacterized protein (DUF849 family)
MTPIAIAVAPNGARKTAADHPALPIAPADIAATARACRDAGAAMLHLHVRKADGTHSLEPEHYRAAIAAVRDAVGDTLVLQLTTEAVGLYRPEQQIAAMRTLKPEAVSAALRELAPDAAHEAQAADFFQWMWRERIAAQYILYDTADVARYLDLRKRGLLPDDRHWVLFVLGRYRAGQTSSPDDLQPFVDAWRAAGAPVARTPWAMCAFGPREADCAAAAMRAGGHVRLGFENNMRLPDGTLAPDNAALVANFAAEARRAGHAPMDADALRALCG